MTLNRQFCGLMSGVVLTMSAGATLAQQDPIIHDSEYYILQSQHGDRWQTEDQGVQDRLAEIRAANDGKPPNIIFVLIDDLGFGDIGIPELSYVRGSKTPHINDFANQGMNFMRMYTEPSCTPTRIAAMTGRHPVRTGMQETKGATTGEGLAASEVTLAEILSQSGYATSHIGKWHMGDIEESYPHNQGFDWAAFPVHQQAQLSVMTRDGADGNIIAGYDTTTQSNAHHLDRFFRPNAMVYGLEGEKGGTAREVGIEAGEVWTHEDYVEMNLRYQRQAIEQLRKLAAGDQPFYLQYWPLWPVNFSQTDVEQAQTPNGGLWVERMATVDQWFGDILAEVDELGVADNTIIIAMGDNGPMLQYLGTTGFSEGVYRGGKGQHLEGGVRVNAFMRWPGVLEENTMVGDITHISDLYTTLARIGGGTEFVPRDRIVDGLDQTSLLFNGEGYGRRDYVFIYENEVLRSIVKNEYKWHLPAPGVGGAFSQVYNLYRDPREELYTPGNAIWTGASFQDMLERHRRQIGAYPHTDAGQDVPYEGIENLRPETVELVDHFNGWKNAD
ncbi:sulfatase-like hydrolase/transferase [Ruegeria arenilitoris]|uniref:sulfatase-like hydrolase/transferase n=1 Tax=Ruegeria arenilitoris TaxID=1173585 RepID=UPI0020C58B23|nr:sulfatase-like hydrolase/transferase [Ruegeria arenilitoris]